MKNKNKRILISAILAVSVYLLGVITPIFYLSNYFHLSGSKTISVKKFPDWGGTITWEDDYFTTSMLERGCIIEGKTDNFKHLHVIIYDEEVIVTYSGNKKFLRTRD